MANFFRHGAIQVSPNWLAFSLLIILMFTASWAGALDQADFIQYDTWFRLRGPVNPGTDYAIIAIDEKSIEALGPFPWPRSVHGRLLEKLTFSKTVGLDLIFDYPSDPKEDSALSAAMALGRVVLASTFTFETDENGETLQVFNPPFEVIQENAAGLGFTNMPTETDGVTRRVTLIDTNTFDDPFPSFGLAVALSSLNTANHPLVLRDRVLTAGNRSITLDDLNMAMPDFPGPAGTFPTYSYIDVIEGKVSPDIFKDKIVLVGITSVMYRDYFPTPFTTSNLILSGHFPTPGVEIHATVLRSILEGNWYQKTPALIHLAFLLTTAVVTFFLSNTRSPWHGLSAAFALAAVITGASYLLWRYLMIWLPIAPAIIGILFIYIIVTASNFVRAEIERRRIKTIFGRYVSPAVVKELMDKGEIYSLGGQRTTVTIMFCDIRGFTSYSEHRDPEEIVCRLNEYLTAMTRIIFRQGGTLDKYLGDGLMAIFGAPVAYQDHVSRAVTAALQIKEAIEQLNKAWSQKNEPLLNVGIGINSGTVLIGNVGSPERMDYTAIGNEVNLASRLEGLTKTFNTSVVLGEKSANLLKEQQFIPWAIKEIGYAEIKGFTEPVRVYTVIEYRKE